MVNGNVLERGKRDKLGHRGSKGLAGPQPAPLGYSPVMGGGGGLLATLGGAPGVLPSPGSWSTELPAPPASQFGSCPVAMSWGWRGPSWARSAPNLGWRGCVQGSHWKRFNAVRGSALGCGGTGPFHRGFGVTSAGRLQKERQLLRGVTAQRWAVMGAGTLRVEWDVGSPDTSPFPVLAHVARRGGWFRFAVSSYSHFLTCEWRRSNLVCSR